MATHAIFGKFGVDTSLNPHGNRGWKTMLTADAGARA